MQSPALLDQIVLIIGILLMIGILSSKVSARIGLPVLVLFVAIGMLAGEDGIGGLVFDNVGLAHGVGTLALAAILFDGGLRTPMRAIRMAWKPAGLLATVGVLGTALITGIAAAYILEIPLLHGILLGSIVGSTDAAAVFSLLRHAGVNLRERLAATLEIESGSNDPMAIFLTIGIIEVLLGQMQPGVGMLQLFVMQMGLGTVIGLAVGWLGVRIINGINLEAQGLYPVLAAVVGLLAFGTAAVLGGSGFLSIYLAGIVLGNSRMVFQRGTFLFHDGLAWIGQILMFVVLGLLSTPGDLLEVAGSGLLIAAVLILVARPLAVAPLLLPFGFDFREITLVSWVGLKGAVPIVLAMFPLLFGLPDAALLFNVVFFVVLVSAVTQGWSLAWVARRLGLEQESQVEPPVALEIVSLREFDADIVEYTLSSDSRAAGRRLDQLALPEGVVIAMVARRHAVLSPRRSRRLHAGDHVFIVLQPRMRALVDRMFSGDIAVSSKLPSGIEFHLPASATVKALQDSYGVRLGVSPYLTLDEAVRNRADAQPSDDMYVTSGQATLHVVETAGDRVITVGVQLAEPTSVDVITDLHR